MDSSLKLRTICNELAEVSHKAYEIGIQLGISHSKALILKQEGDIAAIFNFWLCGNVDADNVPVTWSSIVAALESKQVGEIKLAAEIRKKYCGQQDDFMKLQTVCNELEEVKNKVYEIGIQLGISCSRMMILQQEKDVFSAVIDFWLHQNIEDEIPVAWSSIVAALESDYVGENELATKIRTKYCGQQKEAASAPQYDDLHRVQDQHSSFTTTTSRIKIISAPTARTDDIILHLDSHFNTLNTTLCKSVSTQWENVGSFLGVDPHTIEKIEKEKRGDVYACFREMLKAWLRSINPLPTKAKILEVLRELDFHEKADMLEKRL